MTPTRYPPLGLDRLDGSTWSFFDISDPSRPARVGPLYRTKMEALADLERYWRDNWQSEEVTDGQ